jgi:hypothetical protein
MDAVKKKKLALFVFIDAFGWEVRQRYPDFLKGLVQDEKKLRSIFGYSCACDPSIISGLKPWQHKHWSSFYYAPGNCPYSWVKPFRYLPSIIMNNHRTRSKLSKIIAKVHKFTGYFQVYNVPFKYLPIFDYAEKNSIWKPGGLNEGKSIFDHLSKDQRKYYVPSGYNNDEFNLAELKKSMVDDDLEMAYITLGKLDGLMHHIGKTGQKVDDLMDWYDGQIRDLHKLAGDEYEDVSLYVFSDHGMHNVDEEYNLIAEVESLEYKFEKDYVAVYDSTMARFWFFNDEARKDITAALNKCSKGRMLSDDELRHEGTYFEDSQFGECCFVMNGGVQIVPSFMGQKGCKGMHGYHPDEDDTYSAMLSSEPLPKELTSIEQIFWLMVKETGVPVESHPEKALF